MSKEKYLQFIASFLIVLVLTIPFYTTSVYATISKVTVKGSDGIESYAKATDFLNFNVQASITNDTITNDQVVLGSNIQFDRCTASISNGSECTLRFPGNGTEQFEAKSVPFTINLFKDDKSLDDSKTGSVTIDNKAPQVKLNSQSKFSSQQNVVIDYDVTDFACDDSSCNNKCVGIKSIEFFTQDGAFKQTINPVTNECNVKSSIIIDPKTFNDGKNSVFAKVTDKFNQVSPETSITFTVDSSGPSIVANSFSILRKGISISTFPSLSIAVDVVVNISGGDLNLNSVTADLSALNPSQSLKKVKASCIAVEDSLSTCKWGIELNPQTGGLKTIVINASDTSGNTESATISKILSIDEKGPVVESLSTLTTAESKVLAKTSGNTVIAVFEEATGLSADEMFLHVGSSKIKATRCAKETNWVCIWENVNFNPVSKMSIEADSTDILGNHVSQDIYVEITLDKQAPVLRSINITPVGGLVPAFPGFAKIGDKIAVVANITEDNDVLAVADFSKFISGASKVAGQCERIQADEHICAWLTDSINLQASDVITFNFSDNAGNTNIVTRSFKTFGLENTTVPDFWSNTVDCSPRTIDRELGPLINQRVYCQVRLNQKSTTKAVSTIFIGPATCSGNGSAVVQNVETLNTEVGSKSPIIKITLKKDDFKINNAELSCSFNIFSKIGSSTTITKNPEIENVNINISFFNLPLGEVSQEVQRKIDDAKKDAEGIWKLIETLNKFVFYAKKICHLFGVLYNIIAILYAIAIVLQITKDTTCSNPYTIWNVCPAAFSSATNSCFGQQAAREVAQTGFSEYGQKFCKFVNCKWTGIDAIDDYKEWLAGKINELPLAGYLPTRDKDGNPVTSEQLKSELNSGLAQYSNPQTNLITATLFACLPGIIYSLDKYRQIKCLYADCLQNAVGKEGLPVTACEDQKSYATCKYVTGEIFAFLPWTAVFDHFIGLIKNAMSNPFSALAVGVALLCKPTCAAPAPTGTAVLTACEGFKLFSTMGEVIGNVKNIIDEGFKIRTDYCSRLDN
ncbi:hypothetical protein J4448_01195 [Candidatus Woesearchaeota archaeon]|nr:hypothetical protein [Candidatus Woesearchaeota archaeon]